MGINKSGWRLLAMLKRLELIDLQQVAMLGRQQLFVSRSELPAEVILDGFEWGNEDYAEPLFVHLGAGDTVSYDYSDYEGATYVHDFGKPIPTEHHKRYTLAYDGGSIEHILSPKQVIENMNAILKESGTLIVHTQCNGAAAHGFYQLSPEFFYSVLSPQNGFDDTRVFLVDVVRDAWYLIMPPSVVGGRNTIPNRRFDILCVSRKIADVSNVEAQQSDYEIAWQKAGSQRKRPKRWRYILYPPKWRHFLQQTRKVVPETATVKQVTV